MIIGTTGGKLHINIDTVNLVNNRNILRVGTWLNKNKILNIQQTQFCEIIIFNLMSVIYTTCLL